MHKIEDNLKDLFLSFSHLGPQDEAQVIILTGLGYFLPDLLSVV